MSIPFAEPWVVSTQGHALKKGDAAGDLSPRALATEEGCAERAGEVILPFGLMLNEKPAMPLRPQHQNGHRLFA